MSKKFIITGYLFSPARQKSCAQCLSTSRRQDIILKRLIKDIHQGYGLVQQDPNRTPVVIMKMEVLRWDYRIFLLTFYGLSLSLLCGKGILIISLCCCCIHQELLCFKNKNLTQNRGGGGCLDNVCKSLWHFCSSAVREIAAVSYFKILYCLLFQILEIWYHTYCFAYYLLPDIIQKSFCTQDGVMDPTFQMNCVQAF